MSCRNGRDSWWLLYKNINLLVIYEVKTPCCGRFRVIITWAGYYFSPVKQAERTAVACIEASNRYINDYAHGRKSNLQEVVKYVAPDDRERYGELLQEAALQKSDNDYFISRLKVEKVIINGQRATVALKYAFKTESDLEMYMNLRQIDGPWYVYIFF